MFSLFRVVILVAVLCSVHSSVLRDSASDSDKTSLRTYILPPGVENKFYSLRYHGQERVVSSNTSNPFNEGDSAMPASPEKPKIKSQELLQMWDRIRHWPLNGPAQVDQCEPTTQVYVLHDIVPTTVVVKEPTTVVSTVLVTTVREIPTTEYVIQPTTTSVTITSTSTKTETSTSISTSPTTTTEKSTITSVTTSISPTTITETSTTISISPTTTTTTSTSTVTSVTTSISPTTITETSTTISISPTTTTTTSTSTVTSVTTSISPTTITETSTTISISPTTTTETSTTIETSITTKTCAQPTASGYIFYPGIGYYKIFGPADQSTAKAACESAGGHLVVVDSSAEYAAVQEVITNHFVFLGLTYYPSVLAGVFIQDIGLGTYKTDTDKLIDASSFMKWNALEPNTALWCAVMVQNSDLSTFDCSQTIEYMCEIEITC